MKTKDLRAQSAKDLSEMLAAKREKLRELKFNLASGKVKNIRELHAVKKDIAKILTLLGEGKTT